jgi:hypothetical protein
MQKKPSERKRFVPSFQYVIFTFHPVTSSLATETQYIVNVWKWPWPTANRWLTESQWEYYMIGGWYHSCCCWSSQNMHMTVCCSNHSSVWFLFLGFASLKLGFL